MAPCRQKHLILSLDDIYYSEVRNLRTDHSERIENTVTDNVIELRWAQAFYKAATFNFTVAAKKYGERGQGSAFMLADKTPNAGHAQFP